MPQSKRAILAIAGIAAYTWLALLLPLAAMERYCPRANNCCLTESSPTCIRIVDFVVFLWATNVFVMPLLAAVPVYSLLGHLQLFAARREIQTHRSHILKPLLMAGACAALVTAAVIAVAVTGRMSSLWVGFVKFGDHSVSVGLGAFIEFLLAECALLALGLGLSCLANRYSSLSALTVARCAIAFVIVGLGLYVPFFLSPLAAWRG